MTLENRSTMPLVIYYEVSFAEVPVPAQAAYFHAQFRMLDQLVQRTAYTIVDGIRGKGQYVGTALSHGARSPGWWGEGEVKFYVDGDTSNPSINGYQATREIRLRERGASHIPIIALTADAMQGTEQLCREAGMDDYLTKPLDRARLSKALQRHLGATSPRLRVVESATPSSRAHVAASAPVDWGHIMTVSNGDQEFAQELVQLFIDSGDAALRKIREALDRGDLVTMGSAAHSFKGSSANIHAELASAAAGRLEEAARAGDIDRLAGLEEQLRQEAELAFEYLRARR